MREIAEKPEWPPANYVVTGLYFYDEEVADIVATLRPLAQDELEISDLDNHYLRQSRLELELLRRGFAWLDTATPESVLHASTFVAAIEALQELKIACSEETWWQDWIDNAQFEVLAAKLKGNCYGCCLMELVQSCRRGPNLDMNHWGQQAEN